MENITIRKEESSTGVQPVMSDYERKYNSFDWDEARAQLDGLAGGGLNIAHECVDRHVAGERADDVALRWIGAGDERREFTYRQLAELSDRFGAALQGMGITRGDRVFTLCGRIPPLYITALGTLKSGNVFCPMFSAFGPEPIIQRLGSGEGKVLVTTARLYRDKVAGIRDQLPALQQVIIADEADDLPDDTVSFERLVERNGREFSIEPTDSEDPALLHYTSGTTGAPKGVMHVHEAVVAHHITGQMALDFHDDDVFWCTADPGWVTGTSYGIISPLTNGVEMVVDAAEFNARRWYRILQDEEVTVWYTAPTAIRMLMKAGPELAEQYDLSKLRFIASVGEPLNPEAVLWGQQVLGLPIHDNWWQSETGGIMISNYASMDIKPGSMGRPLPGVEAAVVKRDDEGQLEVIAPPHEEGELALKKGWPSMFRGYLEMEEKYQNCFVGDWYLTGDMAKVDEDGYFFFVGRADDLIKSAGHLIGPFEVESTLLEHPSVVQAAVIGIPHETAGEVVKAFVELGDGYQFDRKLRRELKGFARSELGPAVAPRYIEAVEEIPRTRSGKIMRRLLKARELGEPEGDTSTLEGGST